MRVILDTNIWVAASFQPRCKAGQLVEWVREGKVRMVWSEATRRESAFIVGKIPPIDWGRYEDLFLSENEIKDVAQGEWPMVEDHDDWKFVDAAVASGAVIVSNDEHLLGVREKLPVIVKTSGEAVGIII